MTSTALSAGLTHSLCGAWNVVSAPNVSAINYLKGVSAISPNDVWAVGYHSKDRTETEPGIWNKVAPDQTLILHWDGSAWSHIPSPNAGPGDNVLLAMHALTNDDAWAVGYHNQGRAEVDTVEGGHPYWDGVGPEEPLILRWNGKTWSHAPAPTPRSVQGVKARRLTGVVAISSTDVWAVGYSDLEYDGDPNKLITTRSETLTLHWDGSTWTEISGPSPGQYANRLYAVAATSRDDVWAVGQQSNDGPLRGPFGYVTYPLALHWNGAEWGIVSTPRLDEKYGMFKALLGVAALSADNVWAVGYAGVEGTSERVVLRWDGEAWSEVRVPAPEPPDQAPRIEFLTGVSAISEENVWIAGYYTPYEPSK